jgi:gamma-glutamylcyclotransferase
MIAYFAYGSNLCSARMLDRIPTARARGVATLSGHTLRWHKRSSDNSGKCDAFSTGSAQDTIIGVVFEIPEGDKPELDRLEGLGHGYKEASSTVQASDGTQINVVYYVAEPDHIDPALIPYDWYKEHVQCGARDFSLPETYRATIETTPSKADPNAKRASKERAVRLRHPAPTPNTR